MLSFDHVVFPISDPKATLAFYEDFLGLPLIAAHQGEDWGGYPWLMMIFGLPSGQELVTVALRGRGREDSGDLPADARHYALSAGSAAAWDDWRTKLVDSDRPFWEETHGERRSLYFADPDGIVLEVTWPPADPAPKASAEAKVLVERWAECPSNAPA